MFLILVLLGLFLSVIGTNVRGYTAPTNYNWENEYIYDDTPEYLNNTINTRNQTAGHYPATYSFENEVGLEALEIPFIDGLVGYPYDDDDKIIIIDNINGHDTVLKSEDGGVGSRTGFYNTFDAVVNCTIEFWFMRNQTLGTSFIIFRGETNWVLTFVIYATTIYINGVQYDTFVPFQWNHF